MPLLAGLFVTLFSGFVAWLAQFVTRKVAYAIAVCAAYSVITLALFALLRGTLASLSAVLGSGTLPVMFVKALSMAIPPCAPVCLGAYSTIWIACTCYYWQRDLIKLAAMS
jgi:hypothetical protein